MKQKKQHTKFSVLGWIISILAALFYCYEYLLRIEPSVMVQPLMHNFQVTAGGFGALVAMYYYIYTPMQVVVGVTTDYFGPKRVLTTAIAFCAIGAFLFAYSHVYWIAAVGRLFIGFGSAFAFVGVLKLAAMWLPKKFFAMFVGITTSLGMLGGMFGDIELSRLVGSIGWRAVLFGSAGFGVVLMLVYIFFVKERKPERQVETATINMLMRSLWQIVKTWQLWCAGIIGGLLYLSLSAFAELWGIPFLRSVHSSHKEIADTVNSLVFFGWLIGSPLTGWLSDKIRSRKKPMVIGSLLAAICIGLIVWRPDMNAYLAGTLLFLFGVFASAENLAFVIARERVGLKMTATAVSFINLVVMLGGLIFQPLVGEILDWHWSGLIRHGVHIYQTSDYQFALAVLPIMMLIACVLALTLRETYATEGRR